MAMISTSECTELQAAVIAYRELLDKVQPTWDAFRSTYAQSMRGTCDGTPAFNRQAWVQLQRDMQSARAVIMVAALGGRSESPR